MKMKRIVGAALSSALLIATLAGCGATAGSAPASSASSAGSASSEAAPSDTAQTAQSAGTADTATDENQAAADQLLLDLKGSYQELWPVVLADEYKQVWLDDSAAIVGEENAEAAVEKMTSMVTGTLMGEEAVSAYADGNGVYCCAFTEGVDHFTFDGATISGYDKDDQVLFSHSYHYVGMEEVRGLYEYESDDADAGEFTYFCLAPDTSATTYHIEFRYGSDLDALGQYDAGKYAYWLAAGISTDCDQAMIENSIQLFCAENLAA